MSHITEVKLRVKDLDALEEAGGRRGFELRRGQTSHAWYGRFVGDSEEGRRVANERGEQNLGRCEHALRLKGHQAGDYEIGVAKATDGDGYDLLFDSWGPGRKLEEAAGVGLQKLKQEYAVSVATRQATKKLPGWRVQRENLAGGQVRLRLRRR